MGLRSRAATLATALFVSACSTAVSRTLPPAPTETVAAEHATLVPPRVATPSASTYPRPAETTATPLLPSPTLLALPIRTTRRLCVPIQPVLPPWFQAEGGLVVADFRRSLLQGQLNVMTSATSNPKVLVGAPLYYDGVMSSDGKWLAYEHWADNQLGTRLVLLDAHGEVRSTVPWSDFWLFGPNWLDNERVIFKDPGISPIRFSIIHSNTLYRETFTPDLPGLMVKSDVFLRDTYWGAVPDPTLSRVVYLRRRHDEAGNSLVLRDLKMGLDLWSLDKSTTRWTVPVWSPDGRQFAAAVMNEEDDDWDRYQLFIVDRDGHSQLWVDLRGYFADALKGELQWSPDGRLVAITVVGRPLLILDTERKELLEYCLLGGATFTNVVWSPDSTQLILPRQSDPFLIVDVWRGAAAQAVEDARLRPVGWLAP